MITYRKMNKRKSIKSLKIFLDSSTILSGLASPNGGSGKLLKFGESNKVKLIVNPYIVEEVSTHLQKLRIHPKDLESLLSKKTVFLVNNPPEQVTFQFEKVGKDPKDAPVIAGAVNSLADYLVSL